MLTTSRSSPSLKTPLFLRLSKHAFISNSFIRSKKGTNFSDTVFAMQKSINRLNGAEIAFPRFTSLENGDNFSYVAYSGYLKVLKVIIIFFRKNIYRIKPFKI